MASRGSPRGPGSTWLPFAILKALGLSVAASDENLGPAGSDLDPYDSTRYHHDPRASHGRHRRPSFKRCAPLGMWQHSGTRTYQMPCIASQRLACIAPRAVRPQLSSRNCPARRSIHLCTICLPLSGSSRCSVPARSISSPVTHICGLATHEQLPISNPS